MSQSSPISGTQEGKTCPNCGKQNPVTADFCGNCRQSFSKKPSETSPPLHSSLSQTDDYSLRSIPQGSSQQSQSLPTFMARQQPLLRRTKSPIWYLKKGDRLVVYGLYGL